MLKNLILLGGLLAFTQTYGQKPLWQKNREDVKLAVGLSNFLGDLGGGDQIGRDGIVDYDIESNRPTIQITYGYRLSGMIHASLNLSYGVLRGDDAFTTETYRNGRNLHFKTSFFETSLITRLDMFGSSAKKSKSGGINKKKSGANFYLLGGIGVMFFNPKALYNGNWLNLQELGTEGQGLPGMPSPYKLNTIVMPYGFGIGKDINRQWSVNAELMFRLTFTDYIDDVSTDYYGRENLLQAKLKQGESLEKATAAAALSDPNNYGIDYPELGISDGADLIGEQRGDPVDNDAYLTVMVTLSRRFSLLKSRRRAF